MRIFLPAAVTIPLYFLARLVAAGGSAFEAKPDIAKQIPAILQKTDALISRGYKKNIVGSFPPGKGSNQNVNVFDIIPVAALTGVV